MHLSFPYSPYFHAAAISSARAISTTTATRPPLTSPAFEEEARGHAASSSRNSLMVSSWPLTARASAAPSFSSSALSSRSLPYVKIQSNVRFIRSEILKWMEERQYRPGSRSRK